MTQASDVTSGGKAHFEVLDGLRGSAALLIVLFHIQGITVDFSPAKVLVHHGHLAVDFFFCLSGFVIAYAYDERWSRMSAGSFLQARFFRLHPLVLIGATLGLISYLFDPFAGALQQVPGWRIALTYLLMLLALPAAPMPNRWTDTHPFDGPLWTLFQEYIGSLLYALVLRKLSTRTLGILALAAGGLTLYCGVAHNTMDGGSDWASWWMAPERLAYPFLTGLWLHRVRGRLPRLHLGFLPLTLLMAAALLTPVPWNGLYEALCVLLLFPAIIVMGAHHDNSGRLAGLCRVSGRLSYPIYITHFTFCYVFMNFVGQTHPETGTEIIAGAAMVPFLILVAWIVSRFWDEPVRAWLKRFRSA